LKITIELPEWIEKKNVFVFVGMDHYIAYNSMNDEWWIKTSRCSLCGKCCRLTDSEQGLFGSRMIDGVKYCSMAVKQKVPDPRIPKGQDSYLCGAAGRMPWVCHEDDPYSSRHPECTIRWEKFQPKLG
jgi:hypothetical protein